MPPSHRAERLPAIVVTPPGSVDETVTLFGLTTRERLERGLRAAGASTIEAAGSAPTGRTLFVRGDHVIDQRLLETLLALPDDRVLVGPDGPAAAVAGPAHAEAACAVLRGAPARALTTISPGELASPYDFKLRKVSPPVLRAVDAANASDVEAELFRAAYKGVTDAITLRVWPRPALAATRWCARHAITPNQVTALSYLLTAAVLGLWAAGWFATGLACAWAMTFLDTVDGKLARVTLTSSRIGHVLDHGLDLVHPPFWWAAWAWGLAASAGQAGFGAHAAAASIVVGGYFVGRALEGVFIVAFGLEQFSWRPFDAAFREVIARRNPNLVLLTLGVLLGSPAGAYLAVAAWTGGSIAVQLVRIVQASAVRLAGRRLEPYRGPDLRSPPTS